MKVDPLYENHPRRHGNRHRESHEVVRSDPQAVAFGVRKAIDGDSPPRSDGDFWLTVLTSFEKQFDDDSLMVAVKAAAARAGEPLPNINGLLPTRDGQ